MRWFRGITRNVVILGLVSLFTDMASEMLYPIIPLFLTQTLGLGKDALGLIEGIAEGISTGLRWIGGVLSDLAQKRKPFVLWGYGISALSKPVMGLAAGFTILGATVGGWGIFLTGRAADRLGKSIRTAARDALIADATAPEYSGAAFGLHRAMDTCGAILGPLIALAVLFLWPQTPLSYLFFIAVAPGLVSVLLILLLVRDKPHVRDRESALRKARLWQTYPSAFLRLLAANALFSLGNSSDSLLIQRATEMRYAQAGSTLATTPLTTEAVYATGLFALFNVVYALGAMPAGILSDRIPRKTVIAAGWVVYAAVYAGFGFLQSAWTAWGLFAVYGLYQALTDGVTKAYVTDLVPADRRAGAIGLYYTVAGLGQLMASVGTGLLWQHFGPAWAFGACSACAILAIPLLLSTPSPAAKAGGAAH